MRKLIIWFIIIGLVAVVNCKRKTRFGIAGSKVEIIPIAEILDNPKEYLY